MKKFCFLLLAFSLAFVSGVSAQTPVVIELFTSEGCSSCPPADALLVELSHKSPPSGAQLILLGEHVDYWNYIGWTDRFSSAAFSDRQNNYAKQLHLATVYTPQMVIDGHLQLVGNGAAEVYRDISKAAAEPKPAQVSLRWESQQKLHIAVQTPAGERPKICSPSRRTGFQPRLAEARMAGAHCSMPRWCVSCANWARRERAV